MMTGAQFSFATLSENTMGQMMPFTRKTLQMMQNFYNICNNKSIGILFTQKMYD